VADFLTAVRKRAGRARSQEEGMHAGARTIAVMALTAGCLAAGRAAAGTEPPSCADALSVVGDPRTVDETRRALAVSALAERPAVACRDAELSVARDGDGVHVRLARAGRTVEHTTADVATLTSWVESWLLPDGAAAPPAVQSQAPRAAGVPVEIALRGGVDLDSVGPAWPGAELAVTVGVGRRVSLGIAGAAAWSVEHDATHRRALRISARVAGFPSSSNRLALGCGLGIVSAAAERRLDDGALARDDSAEPFIEVFGAYQLPLAGGLALSLAAVIRGHIPDDFGPETDPDDAFEPKALPGMALTLQAGLSWRFAGGR
jgi:hypothetical protein